MNLEKFFEDGQELKAVAFVTDHVAYYDCSFCPVSTMANYALVAILPKDWTRLDDFIGSVCTACILDGPSRGNFIEWATLKDLAECELEAEANVLDDKIRGCTIVEYIDKRLTRRVEHLENSAIPGLKHLWDVFSEIR